MTVKVTKTEGLRIGKGLGRVEIKDNGKGMKDITIVEK